MRGYHWEEAEKEKHLPTLLRWRNTPEWRARMSWRRHTVTEDEFCREMQDDFDFDRVFQGIVIHHSGAYVGTGILYRQSHGYVFGSVYIDPLYRKGSAPYACLYYLLQHAFEILSVSEVRFETYTINTQAMSLCSKYKLPIVPTPEKRRVVEGIETQIIAYSLTKSKFIIMTQKGPTS